MSISFEIVFQICAPALIINLSAICVFTSGNLISLAVLVGYLWYVLLARKKLSNDFGSREFLNLYINIVAL